MKKLLLIAFLACACLGAELDSKVKGYIDYIAKHTCSKDTTDMIGQSCGMNNACANSMHEELCPPYDPNVDKYEKKLAKVMKAELKNRTETFAAILKYAKERGARADNIFSADGQSTKILEIIVKNNLVEHAKDIRNNYGSLKGYNSIESYINYIKASKEIKSILF